MLIRVIVLRPGPGVNLVLSTDGLGFLGAISNSKVIPIAQRIIGRAFKQSDRVVRGCSLEYYYCSSNVCTITSQRSQKRLERIKSI